MNNQFRTQIAKHLLSILDKTETTDTPQQLQNVVKEFYQWYPRYEKLINNTQKGFTIFLRSFPKTILPEITYYEISKCLDRWHLAGNLVYDPLTTEQEELLYYHLLTLEFTNLCRRYKIFPIGVN